MPNRRLGIYALLIVCLVAGLLSGKRFFFNLSYVLGALLFVSLVWSWTAVNWIRIGRQTRARRAQVGKSLDETFTVRNVGLVPKVWLEIRDHSDVPGHNPSAVVPMLWPRSGYQWTVHTTCVVRGEFTLGPLTLISGDPFGLFQSTRHIDATSKVLIYPAIMPVHSFAAPTGLLSGGDAQRQRTHVVTTNAAGVREYAPGDSFNRIHWKSSARRDRLLVKEFELDPMADVWMYLDLNAATTFERPYSIEDRPYGEFFIPPSSLEYAIIAASSLAQYFLVKERGLGFVTYNPTRCVLQPDRGNRQLTRILETLTVARAETDITCEQLIALEGHHMARGTTAIIITADPSERWVGEATLMARRGMRTIAVVLDAASFGATNVRSVEDTRVLLEASGVITYAVRNGDDLTLALSQRF
jgi:uncharacterized protein (DUF58 family)